MAWRTWFSRNQRDRERDEELREHLAHHEEDLIARGATPEQARRQARLVFGNPRVRREEMDDMLRLPLLELCARDLRYAVRVLRRTPVFTVTTVATLALVIGANTAVFSLANALLLTPLPFPAPEGLALVSTDYVSPRGNSSGTSIDGTTWETLAASGTLPQAAVFTNWTAGVNIVVNNQARFVDQQRVGAGFFGVLGTRPAIGREFTSAEDVPGGPAVAILSYELWARTLGGESSILGQSVLLRGEPWTVVGVMPEGFRGTVDADVWTPLRPTTTGEGGGTNYAAIVRVAEGQSVQDAARRLPDLGAYLRDQGMPADVQVTVGLRPLSEVLAEDNREPIVMLGAAVATVLVIACVNLAALLLARGGARSKEIATRMALGSGRTAVVRQLMAESVVLAIAGASPE